MGTTSAGKHVVVIEEDMWFAMFCSLEKGVEEEKVVEEEDVEGEGIEEARMVRFPEAILNFWAARLSVVLSDQTTKTSYYGW